MPSSFRNSAGVDADDLYAPDTLGDGPPGSGYRRVDGTTLKYAAAKYGTPGAAMGYRLASGVDIGTLWARKGTASHALPIDGRSFGSGVLIPAADSGSANIAFQLLSASTYQVVSGGAGGSLTPANGTVQASGSLPSGSSTIQFVMTRVDTGIDGGGSTNGAASPVAVASGIAATVSIAGNGHSGGKSAQFSVNILIRNAGGAVISNSMITLSAHFEGSA